jgi:hypothetical protein
MSPHATVAKRTINQKAEQRILLGRRDVRSLIALFPGCSGKRSTKHPFIECPRSRAQRSSHASLLCEITNRSRRAFDLMATLEGMIRQRRLEGDGIDRRRFAGPILLTVRRKRKKHLLRNNTEQRCYSNCYTSLNWKGGPLESV